MEYHKINKGLLYYFFWYDEKDYIAKESRFEELKAVKTVYEKLNFVAKEFENLNKKELENTLRGVRNLNLESYDAFCVTIVTQVKIKRKFLIRDGNISSDFIVKAFMGDECENLVGKPKIFLFQAPEEVDYDDNDCTYDALNSSSLPIGADILTIDSSYRGMEEFSNGPYWYLKQMCSEFLQLLGSEFEVDFLNMLIDLNHKVLEDKLCNSKHGNPNNWSLLNQRVPEIMSSLTKKIIFNPGKNIQELNINAENSFVIEPSDEEFAIFNFYDYGGDETREGSKEDVSNIISNFEKFGMKFKFIEDSSFEDFQTGLRKAIADAGSSINWVFLMSHGIENKMRIPVTPSMLPDINYEEFLKKNGVEVTTSGNTNELLKEVIGKILSQTVEDSHTKRCFEFDLNNLNRYFSDHSKINIIVAQMCRGNNLNNAVKENGNNSDKYAADESFPIQHGNVLFFWSTYYNQGSVKTSQGSWFITELHNTFNNLNPDTYHNLLDICVMTCKRVAEKYRFQRFRQMPVINTTLTKHVWIAGTNIIKQKISKPESCEVSMTNENGEKL